VGFRSLLLLPSCSKESHDQTLKNITFTHTRNYKKNQMEKKEINKRKGHRIISNHQ
jgi:hypothetical protein